MQNLEHDFPYRQLAEHANEIPSLQRTDVGPVSVLRFRSVANPQGLIHEHAPTILQGVSHVIVDFGRELVGYLDLVASADQPAEMLVTYGESLEEAVETNCDVKACWFHLPEDRHAIHGEPRAYRHSGRRAFRYVHIRSESPGACIRLQRLRMTLVHYPVVERQGFSSSDPLLNRIWNLCSYTTKLCMQTFYEDGIKRDGLLWVSDYRAQFLCNWTPFGDSALARKSLIQMAASQLPSGFIPACAAGGGGHQHPEGIYYMPGIPFELGTARCLLIHYSTDYLSCLLDYVLHTGDAGILELVWPTVTRLIAAHEAYPYDPNNKELATEADGWKSQGTMLMQVITGLRDGQRVAAIRGDAALQVRCRTLADQLLQRTQREHFDPVAGYFTDEDATTAQGAGSMHVNTFAVIAGAVDAETGRQMLTRALAAKARQASWGGMRMWQHVGEFEAGMADLALTQMRAYWGYMLDHGATTAWECCDLKADGWWTQLIISRCHGWSAGACHLLPRYVLGVRPTAPGFAKVRIRPQLGDLPWATGSVPTPRGEIQIELDAKGGGKATVPDGIEVEDGCPVEVVRG